MKDYYKILGVSDAAEIEVITASYRAMMRKYHPDTNPSPSSGEKAKEIKEAYEVLCDAGKRRNYDQQRQASKEGQSNDQERARQEQEREHKEQAEGQKREQDAQAREQQERESQERVKRECEQQEREGQERVRREREQQERESQERAKREREQQEREGQEPEAIVTKSASSEKNNANQTDADKFSKTIDGSHILIFGALVIGALLVMGYLVTTPSPGEQSSAKIAADNYDMQAADAYEKRDFAQLSALAVKGSATAQFNLGFMYDNGQGVAEDDAAAVVWYRKAAEQGYAFAQLNLGFMYDNGQGVAEDDASAVVWYRKAAEQGDADAQFNLGVMYDNGQGVAKDDAAAVVWYRKAAEQGQASAQYNIALKYENGDGFYQDYVQAHKWFNLSAANYPAGSDREDAKRKREGVAAKMQPDQIAEAQRLASAWRSRKLPVTEPSSLRSVAVQNAVSAAPLARPVGQSFPKPKPAQSVPEPKAALTSAMEPRTGSPSDTTYHATPVGTYNRFSDDDYPSASRAAWEEGITRVAYVVGVDGQVSQCEVVQTSGFQRLDDATCAIIQRRFRFNPATLNGQPVPERKTQSIRWRLTEPSVERPALSGSNFTDTTGATATDKGIDFVSARPYWTYNRIESKDYPSVSRAAEEEGVTHVSYVVGTDGRVTQCEVVQSSGFQRLDHAACAIIQRRFRFSPATLKGRPVTERKTQLMPWRLTN